MTMPEEASQRRGAGQLRGGVPLGEAGLSDVKLVIGRYGDATTGSRLLCVGGLHGNEPAGVYALRRVMDTLEAKRPPFRGELICLAGNVSALRAGARFLERDLNRVWIESELDRLRTGGANTNEEADQLALLEILDEELQRGGGDLHFLDLHTTSGRGVPFALMGDTLRNRTFATSLPIPIVLGLEEQLSGTITEYVNTRGATAVGFEAGHHNDSASVDRHEAAVWIALRACGCLAQADLEEVWRSYWLLQQASAGLPRFLEIRYRHPISPADEFVMVPGFSAFQRVRAGEVLASDRRGRIAAPVDGRILLPLYQQQGNDGFFLAQPVKPFWLKLSAFLRGIHADLLIPLLPGVRRAPDRPGTLLVDPKIARWLSTDIFHLFGYRRRKAEDGLLVFSRCEHNVLPGTHEETGKHG